jgi:site-specific recombinase XerC
VSGERHNVPAVVDGAAPVTIPKLQSSVAVPMMIANAGDHAARRFLEFFAAQIRNKNTRMAYHRACCHFFAWVEQHQIGELADIEPIHVAAYIEVLQTTAAKPTVKLHLAAIRMLFDWLIIGQILAINPAHAVRGPKHVVKRGKTPVLTEEQARQLIQSLDASTLVGARDRALIGVMTYAFARIGAVVAMRVEDHYPAGKRWWVRLHEKGGKRHEMPAITSSNSSSTNISTRRESAMPARPPLPLRGRQDRPVDGQCDAPRRRLSDDPPAHGRGRFQDQARLSRVPRDRHHRLS